MPKYSKPKKQTATSKQSMTPWLVGGGILFVLLIAVAVWANSRGTAAPVTNLTDVPVEWADGKSLGNPEAVVTVQAWEDFLCPACQQWTSTIKPRLYEEYIKTGLVRLEFHQFPLQVHAPGAQMSALATECAADQNAFWPYHDQLFQETASRGQAGATLEQLVNYAEDLNLNAADFRSCMTTQAHMNDITASLNEAVALGLNSTPSILVNDKLMTEAFDYGALSSEIDRLLEAAGVSKSE